MLLNGRFKAARGKVLNLLAGDERRGEWVLLKLLEKKA